MRVWDRFVLLMFPGSLEEYRESHKIHLDEMRRYRKQSQFVAGLFLFFVPLLYLAMASSARGDWITTILVLCLLFGEICIRDTISEHYCLLLCRLGYGKRADPDTPVTQREITGLVCRGSESPVEHEDTSLSS